MCGGVGLPAPASLFEKNLNIELQTNTLGDKFYGIVFVFLKIK